MTGYSTRSTDARGDAGGVKTDLGSTNAKPRYRERGPQIHRSGKEVLMRLLFKLLFFPASVKKRRTAIKIHLEL
jgi:hypothetical protein